MTFQFELEFLIIVFYSDLLVANTTQSEFKEVLEGLCKQTKSFKKECLSIADEYYDVIYAKLTQDLDPNGACFLMGVCPKGLEGMSEVPAQMMPLLPVKVVNEKRKVLGADEPVFSAKEIQSFQLPKDVLILDAGLIEKHVLKKDSELCTLCEYFLHFVQETLASPKNEVSYALNLVSIIQLVISLYCIFQTGKY